MSRPTPQQWAAALHRLRQLAEQGAPLGAEV
jgi:DNA-binding helix-hairpin-helix protein with protein kinase domain